MAHGIPECRSQTSRFFPWNQTSDPLSSEGSLALLRSASG